MTRRTDMLAPTIRKIIAPVLRECPRECGVMTITDIDLSSDLSYATVYVSSLTNPESALAFLERRRRELQKRMGALQTHKTPHLRFRLDTRAQEGNRIEQLLEGGKDHLSSSR